MCGICGVIGISSSEKSELIVRRMAASIVHRGPDGEGFITAPAISAASRRLSIIDLPGGNQPIWNEDGTLAVVFNGEIYNFRELRKELEAAGHRFRTQSDTEIIVHAYEAWGEESVRHLRGMFAFAIVELPQGVTSAASRVFIARDRLGIKPLYYAISDGALLFASEVRALLASGRIEPRLSREAVSSYLLFGSVCEPMTLVDGVMSLPPGHYLSVSADASLETPQPKPYWHVVQYLHQTKAVEQKTQGSPARAVRSLLEDAVRSHLIADVPIGVFLSSGLDSTALAALATRVQGGIHTFTVAFPDEAFSEAEKARRTAKRLGTEHTEFTLSDQEMLTRLEEAVASFDQPSMDGINTYMVSWAARQAGLKVALSGLGSDEIFGGYTSFGATASVATLRRAAALFPSGLRAFAARQFEKTGTLHSSPDRARKALAAWLDPTAFPHAYFFTRTLFTPQRIAAWGADGKPATDSPWREWLAASAQEAKSMDRFAAISWLELRSYLVNTLLRDTDAMSMRYSLEVRVPFLDAPLASYVLSLPESAKLNRARPKALLIDALRDLLPEEIVTQPKRTFTFPWENWLRGPLGTRVAEGLADWSPALAPHLDAEQAVGVWNDFLKGRTSWSRPWSLYVLNEWVKRNLAAPQPASPMQRGVAAMPIA